MRAFLKTIFSEILFRTGILDYQFRKSKDPCCVILMYHRILPEHEISATMQPGMYVEKKTFNIHLSFLKQRFTIISIDNLSKYLNSSKNFYKKPACVITFDDGWYDFYENAYPALMKADSPATVFLPIDYIGTSKMFWTDKLANLLYQIEKRAYLKNKINKKFGFNDILLNLNGDFNENLEKAIELLKRKRISFTVRLIENISNTLKIQNNPVERQFLNWNEIEEMHDSGYINFGSHTLSHEILTNLKDIEIKEELLAARYRLFKKKVVSKAFIPFSYPNGNYNQNIAEIVRDTGHSLAVTTVAGWNYPDVDQFKMRRISLHQDMCKTPALFAARIAGFI